MGRCGLQLSEAVPRRVSLAASSALQSATRPAGSGSVTALLLLHRSGIVDCAIVDCVARGADAPETMWPLMVKTAQHKIKADRMTRAGIRRLARSTCERF